MVPAIHGPRPLARPRIQTRADHLVSAYAFCAIHYPGNASAILAERTESVLSMEPLLRSRDSPEDARRKLASSPGLHETHGRVVACKRRAEANKSGRACPGPLRRPG